MVILLSLILTLVLMITSLILSAISDGLTAATPLVTAIGVLVTVIMQAWNSYQSSKRAAIIENLEKNTNSIKDALVKVTGESEHAKGIVQGRTEATAGIAMAGILEAVKTEKIS